MANLPDGEYSTERNGQRTLSAPFYPTLPHPAEIAGYQTIRAIIHPGRASKPGKPKVQPGRVAPMAKKPATSSKKTTKAPPKKKQPAASTRKPKPPQKTGAAKNTAPEKDAPQAGSGLSLDRKLDITGIVLALVGLLILLVLISSNRSPGSQDIITYLARLFGWGAYLLPVAMIAVGLWLVLRNFERIPRISIERMTGILMFYRDAAGIFCSSSPPPRLLNRACKLPNRGRAAVISARICTPFWRCCWARLAPRSPSWRCS